MPYYEVTRARLKETIETAQANNERVRSIVPVGDKFAVVTEMKEDTTGRAWVPFEVEKR